MKKILLSFAFLVALMGATSPAHAIFIVGQQSFSSPTVVGADNVSDTTFTFSFVTDIAPSQQTGDYIGTFGTFINSLDTTDPASFVFGSAVYGTFEILSVLENSLGSVSRTLNFSGIFHPGAATFPGYDPTPGSLTITINQPAPGAGSFVLSASATLRTAAPEVPEPSTIVLLGTFAVPAAWGWMRRRRSSKSTA